MRPGSCEAEVLRLLAQMPFLDRLELVEVSGWSRGAVYGAVERLETGGFCAPAPHAVDPLQPTRRFHLTAAGLGRLAEQEGIPQEELVRRYPVSAQWRRSLMERLDSLAAVYRLACAVSTVAFPVRFRLYRSLPLDAGLTLPGGRTVGILRQGLTADRTGFAKRLWRLREGPLPGTVLVLAADQVRLRHARRLLAASPVPALLAVESAAALAGAGDRIWSPPAVNAALDLRYVLERADPGGELPVEDEPQRATLPDDFAFDGPGWDIPDHLLPVLLKAAEKRALDLVSDWPWLAVKELAGLLGVSTPRASQVVNPLVGFGLVARVREAGDAWVSPTGGWRCWPIGTAPPWAWRRSGGASPPMTPGLITTGATSPAGTAASCSATSSTPPPSTPSWPPWPARPASWAGRCRNWTRHGGPPAISATRTGCARSTPTPSAR